MAKVERQTMLTTARAILVYGGSIASLTWGTTYLDSKLSNAGRERTRTRIVQGVLSETICADASEARFRTQSGSLSVKCGDRIEIDGLVFRVDTALVFSSGKRAVILTSEDGEPRPVRVESEECSQASTRE